MGNSTNGCCTTRNPKIDELKYDFNKMECCICLDPLSSKNYYTDIAILPCSHLLHTECMKKYTLFKEDKKNVACPLCQRPIFNQNSIVNDIE